MNTIANRNFERLADTFFANKLMGAADMRPTLAA
jgi:hypothetical protein